MKKDETTNVVSPNVAEWVGFEPTDPVKGLPDFESGPL